MGEESGGGVAVNVECATAMLALTAIHDIMKVDALLPTVQRAHAPYKGFRAGDRINDHHLSLQEKQDAQEA